jgi:hypothetical protein
MTQKVNTLGEALSVFVQVAELAQAKGVLSFDDAIVAKSAIDFVTELSKQSAEAQTAQTVEAPHFETTEVVESKPSKRAKSTTTEG